MCDHVDQSESVSTMLGVMSCIYNEHPEDAKLLIDLYSRGCHKHGASDVCVLSSLLNANVYVTLMLLGEEGKSQVDSMAMWWAEHWPT